jgi:hypothetical protein
MMPDKQIHLRQLIFVSALVVVSSCQKVIDLPADTHYPTTFYQMSNSEYGTALAYYFGKNPDIVTGISRFGFCLSIYGIDKDYYIPQINKNISLEEAISLAKAYISKNPKETGISDTSLITFQDPIHFWGYDSASFWIMQTQTQVVDSMEIMYSNVTVSITNGIVVQCTGNWYPEIYIPSKFNISSEKALHDLVGKDCGHYGWAGPMPARVKQSDLGGSEISKLIYPFTNGSIESPQGNTKIELRIVYKINLPSTGTIFYIDVMNGMLVAQETTWWF